mmetsp:Transcript_9582/g.14429  ORF Transcript_9582/g.14429 Transcript_9582/m.14429 type:complete len:242 (-) Transcript_9582:198-923(-)|eukprot:CAMPEP_0185032486 /NCGR_PEP_ID=MMETSP1103-20130426/20600_1 /TAXON_ID=36769 /ORGANISM="Paraphysomonas bandaiensis, Strain Caron Lab Isolate" /LENGTH=241 /DNA_ID=CAMNT_0027568407 /DNA_START=157 /DNA_END=882 /DNA_ORIENTATION=+
MEEIKQLAQEIDEVICKFEDVGDNDLSESDEHRVIAPSERRQSAEHCFELALAESEKESLQDDVAMLSSRNEELEDCILHQRFIIDLLKNLNEKLYKKAGTDDEALNEEIRQLNDTLLTYNDRSLELQENSSANTLRHSKYIPSPRKTKSNTKMAVEMGEMQLMVSQLKGSLAAALARQEDHQRIRRLLEQELNEERLKRLHAEKQRDAYALAYEDSLLHFKKIGQEKATQIKKGRGNGKV